MASEFTCSICCGSVYQEYDYPVGWETRLEGEKRKRTFWKVLRNNFRYVVGSLIVLMPDVKVSKIEALHERASHRQWLSRSQISILERNLRRASSYFEGRKIRVCRQCGFGAVFPMLSETVLVEYYATAYWRALESALLPCENPRTMSLYKMAEDKCVPFENVSNCIEFGSADARLSRYFQIRQPHLEISVIEPGENWRKLLQSHVKSSFSHIAEVSGTYDLFLSSHSLEHVADIQYYWNSIMSLVNDGGYLVFEVPNSEEADVIFDKKNPDYHIPHTYFFTPTSIERLAETWGLRLIAMKTFNRSYRQILNEVQNGINGSMENPKGAYLRVVLQKSAPTGSLATSNEDRT